MADVPSNSTTTARFEEASQSGIILNVWGSYSGTLEAVGDRDWIAVTLFAGRTYRFWSHLQIPGSGTGDSFLSLKNAAGTVLASNDDNGGGSLNSSFTLTATTTGTYFRSFSCSAKLPSGREAL